MTADGISEQPAMFSGELGQCGVEFRRGPVPHPPASSAGGVQMPEELVIILSRSEETISRFFAERAVIHASPIPS
jgi:hypothetical protein